MLGWPVAHSRSPAMQNAALRAAGLGATWRYQLLPVPPELLAETVAALPAAGFRGVNVTIPHKEAALALATDASARAVAIGAANTLLFGPDGEVWADNTDAVALTDALGRLIELRGASALVLGAGGSARAAAWALRDAGAREIRVWNRTPGRAEALAAGLGVEAGVDAASAAPGILVNCTSVGLHGEDQLAALPVSADQLGRCRAVVDFVYAPEATTLVRAARAAAVPTVDGIELLIGQGAVAFERFTGRAAPLPAMRAALGLSSAR